jgi:hypothetical protein
MELAFYESNGQGRWTCATKVVDGEKRSGKADSDEMQPRASYAFGDKDDCTHKTRRSWYRSRSKEGVVVGGETYRRPL